LKTKHLKSAVAFNLCPAASVRRSEIERSAREADGLF